MSPAHSRALEIFVKLLPLTSESPVPTVELHEIEHAMAKLYTDTSVKGQEIPKGKIQLTNALAGLINRNMTEGKQAVEGITFMVSGKGSRANHTI